jgi:hypothetical protein
MEIRDDGRTLAELLAKLSRDTAALVHKEVELARTELSATLSHATRHVVFVAAGTLLAYAGLLVLLAAGVVLLQAAGLTWWASALIVGIVSALAGWLLVQRGISALQKSSFVPTQTIETLKENAAWVKGQRT